MNNITSDLGMAVQDASIIFVTLPAFEFKNIALKLEKVLKPGQWIVAVPGSGGAEFAFSKLVDMGCVLFGFQRVHSIARLKEYGKSVYMLGRKQQVEIASVPSEAAADACPRIEELLGMPCIPLPNYLCVTLTPSNPILHTTRLYSMFKDWKRGMTYPRNFLFYEEWDDASSDMLIKCDDELQQLCKVIPEDLSSVRSLKVHYESYTVHDMTKKISGIKAFKGLTSPIKEVEGGWVPDFNSRYFTADFEHGLKIIIDIADKYNVPVPNMKRIWKWYEDITKEI